MTFQHISTPAGRVVSMAEHHARHGHTAEQREAAGRLLSDREIGTAMARDFDAAVRSAPTFPRGRRRDQRFLSGALVGCVVGLVLAWAYAAWGAV